VFGWHKSSKKGRELLQDDERKNRSSTSRTKESTEVIQKCFAVDRTLNVRMSEEITGINRETVCNILVKYLRKNKVCARFVPHLLKPDQEHQRAASSAEFVEMTDDDRNVLKRIATGDESWCFMYDPERKLHRVQLG
jgi:hypothetical protein